MVDGKWAIVSEYIKGKTLAQLMAEDEDKKSEYPELFCKISNTAMQYVQKWMPIARCFGFI